MRLGKVDFPEPVVAAARNHELVVFAGAGVSMGEPAGLPGFRALTEKIAEQSGENELDVKKTLDSISPDKYLGRLKSRGTDVHALAAEEFLKPGIRHTELHRVLLSLYPGPEAVRVVTTNYDLLFEQAAEDVFPAPTMPAAYSSGLPTRKDFRGIVHLHGDVAHSSDMVLTKNDFAVAYLGDDPWAQRFVINLLSANTLLFVGYSGDDVIFDYLISGLLSAESPRHFAMVRVEDEQKWLERGIQAVLYPASLSDPDGALCESLSSLAEYAGAGVAEQQSRIRKLASQPPSELNREQIDLVADALSDSVRQKFFTRVADSPEWIAWLDERKYLDTLFGDEPLSERDSELAEWLAWKFVHGNDEKLFTLIGKHKTRLCAEFWRNLLWRARMPTNSPADADRLERWVSLLILTAPPRVDDFDLFLMGEHCIECGLTDSVAEIFQMLVTCYLTLGVSSFQDSEREALGLGVDAEFSPIAGQYELSELWQKGLRPNLSQVAGQLLPILIENLARQHRTLCLWGKASQDGDPISFDRSAIEPHDQDCYPESVDVVIDATRDCLQWLAKHERGAVLYWCGRLAKEQAPILRRLAVYTLTELSDVPGYGSDEKIDWLLSHVDINEYALHHEVFRAMQSAYPSASQPRRQAVIDSVWALRLSDDAYAYFNWFHWLHISAPDCDLAKKARDQVLDKHPEFRPREHPDFEVWAEIDAEFIRPYSPLSFDQLLAEPAEHWVSKLLARAEDFPWESGLHEQVAKAARMDFRWGVDWADALAEKEEWESNLWRGPLQAWAEVDEDGILELRVLRYFSRSELSSNHPRAAADLLLAWAKSGRHTKLLDDADHVAARMWPALSQNTEEQILSLGDGFEWLTTSLNRSPGILAQYWFERFRTNGLHGECRTALSAIAQNSGVAGRLGRAVLAGGLRALLQKDESWAQKNLLSFFELHADQDIEDCQAVWEGFLCRPRIDDRIFGRMEKAFLSVAAQLQSDRCFLKARLRKQFLRVCARIVLDKHFVLDPLDKWLPSVLRNCGVRDMVIFITEIGRFLKKMNEEEQEESWHRWLKEYWRLRQHGAIAGSLTREEATGMFHWLPCLRGTVFSEAVDLAEQISPAPRLRHGFLFRELDEAGLYREQPEAVARLLLCLGEAESPRYAWVEAGKLIRKLLTRKIPAELKSKLEDLSARRDISVAKASIV